MKKILCLLLTLVLSIGLVSCNLIGGKDSDDGNGANGNQGGSVDTIAATVNSSTPTQIVTKVDYTAAGMSTVTSSYVTERDSKTGAEKFTFHIVRYATVEEMLPSATKTIEGTVWKNADGSVTNSNGDSWSAADAVGYLAEKLNLKSSYFKSYEISDNGNDLTAYVTAANSERVFGAKIDASGDIKLVVDTNGTYLYNVTVTYETVSGATVNIVTSYDYAVIDLSGNN